MDDTEKAMHSYVEAYSKLYNRHPSELRALDEEWVVVNGAQMRIGELVYLTNQLQQEYKQAMNQKRNMVKRLISWFRG
jgi:hypothetical protein